MKLLPLYSGPNRDGGTGHHGGFCKPYSFDRRPFVRHEAPDCGVCNGVGTGCPACVGSGSAPSEGRDD